MSMASATKPADFARLIAAAEAEGCGFRNELLRPAMRGELNLLLPMRDTLMPSLHRVERRGRPVAVIVGDDDYTTTGPAGWACAAKLRSWARFAIIHGSAGTREHYAAAALIASQTRRLLFIETSSAAAQHWAGFLRERDPALPFMGVLPPDDGAHPVLPARETMQ